MVSSRRQDFQPFFCPIGSPGILLKPWPLCHLGMKLPMATEPGLGLVLGVSPGLALMKPWAPSTQMAIVFNQEGLSAIQPPCVVQNFINHNAVLYKVFVVGDSYTVVQRPSLKNFSAGTSGNCSPTSLP